MPVVASSVRLLPFCCFLFFLWDTTPVHGQSPWVRSKAGFYVQATVQTLPAYNSVFGESGEKVAVQRRLSEQAFQVYAEYGLSSKTTLIGVLPVRQLRSGEALVNPPVPNAGRIAGPGNPVLMVRRQLTAGRLSLTATLRMETPVNRYDDASGLRTGYRAFAIQPLLSSGMGFGRWYWFAHAGCGWRTDGYSPFLQTGAESGLQIRKMWWMLYADWMHPAEKGRVLLPPNNALTFLYVNNQGWVATGVKTLIPLGRFWGITAAATTALQGRNVPAQRVFSLGGWFKWD